MMVIKTDKHLEGPLIVTSPGDHVNNSFVQRLVQFKQSVDGSNEIGLSSKKRNWPIMAAIVVNDFYSG